MGQPIGAQITNYLLEKVSPTLQVELMIGTCGRSDQGGERFPHLLPVHKGSHCRTKGFVDHLGF
jgi:hypothetical protein